MISVKVDDDHERQTADRTFDVMLSSDHAGTVFTPGKTWSFTIPPSDLEVRLDPSMGPIRFKKGTAEMRFTVDGLQNSKTFAVSSTDARIAVRTGLITIDKDPFDFFDVVLSPTEGAELERKETIELEISHLDAFSRDGAQISTGAQHACAIRINNTVACWGSNDDNRLDPIKGSLPRDVITAATKFLAVSAGLSHSCGIRIDNTIACWGANGNNQLDSTMSPHGQVTTATKFLAVGVAGERENTCAIRIDRTLACWGITGIGRISGSVYSLMGSTRDQGGPINADDEFLAVSAGSSHACGIRITGAPACLAITSTFLPAKPASIQAAVIPDTFYLLEKRDMNVPAELQSAVRLRVKVFLEGALR